MKYFLLLILGCIQVNLFSQSDTTVYFSKLNTPVASISEASLYETYHVKDNNNSQLSQFFKSEDKWTKAFVTDIKKKSDSLYILSLKDNKKSIITRQVQKTDSGFLIKDFFGKILVEEGLSKTIFPLIKNGYWKSYNYESGKIKLIAKYINNQCIHNKFWYNDSEYLYDVFTLADKEPDYEGGIINMLKFIAEKANYYEAAAENSITGRVVVGLVIMSDGTIKGVHLIQRVNPLLDIEAYRVVNSIPNKWIPAEIADKKVNFLFAIPLNFTIK